MSMNSCGNRKDVSVINHAMRHYPYEPILLPYSFNALYPYLDARTLKVHYHNLYFGYVEKLNNVLKTAPAYQSWSLEELLKNNAALPEALQTPIRRFAGGVYNHELYFLSMSPRADYMPSARVLAKLTEAFGSYDGFVEAMILTGTSVFGSGYAYLAADETESLRVIQTANQDTPYLQELTPLLPVDVWEHAYFLQYTSHRDEYLRRWFHIINWKAVEARFLH